MSGRNVIVYEDDSSIPLGWHLEYSLLRRNGRKVIEDDSSIPLGRHLASLLRRNGRNVIEDDSSIPLGRHLDYDEDNRLANDCGCLSFYSQNVVLVLVHFQVVRRKMELVVDRTPDLEVGLVVADW